MPPLCATNYLPDTLLIDTGSSNTWVDGKKYVKTKTSKTAGGSIVRIACSTQFMLADKYVACVLRQWFFLRNGVL
jgi:hypothetical protein